MNPLPRMPHPCDETRSAGRCPFRVDAEAGEFPASRFESLAVTAGREGAEAPPSAPMFACHHGQGAQVACAGWLAVAGYDHLGVRMAISDGRLTYDALHAEGYELFDSYDDMAVQQSDGVYDRALADAYRDRAGHNWPLDKKLSASFGACDIDERGSADPDTRLRLGAPR